jgi:hypothetical protein
MKTVGQRNLKLLGGQGKTDGRTVRPSGSPDGQADSSILPLQLRCAGYNYDLQTYLIESDGYISSK